MSMSTAGNGRSGKRKRGRPPEAVPQDVADTICRRLEMGESLRAICESEGMPTVRTVFDWVHKSPDFAQQYARARDAGCELEFDEIKSIADDVDGDTDRARLRVDARKWRLSKQLPRKFGDRIGVEHAGGVSVQATITPAPPAKEVAQLVDELTSLRDRLRPLDANGTAGGNGAAH
jgi:hypothetical protein